MTSLQHLTATTDGLPCRTQPDLYFSPDPIERRDAARRCHTCPLLLACMQYALDADEQHGVWGGVDFAARAIGCGNERAYRVHIRRGEEACPMCQAAHDEAVEADRRRRLDEAHAVGGTVRGYWMHRRLEESACLGCRRAVAAKSAERRERDRVAADEARAAWDARKAAERAAGPQAGTQPLALAG